ncbi:MAG: hypothetical protein OEV76_04030 [Anaerolineae bacterium]|nr:hypothetical protein [Anaerolineae bacterium]
MVKRFSWQIILGLTLIALSALVYVIHYLIFRDAHHIFIYLIGDVAFVFIEVLMVTLIIHEVLTLRAKRAIMEKLNMVVGAFFSEVGTALLKIFSQLDPEAAGLREGLILSADTSASDLSVLGRRLDSHRYTVNTEPDALHELQGLLVGRRDFLLRLLENPNLLEHESFTNTLWAVFHLADELGHRSDVQRLPASDYKHLAGDMTRAYKLLAGEWLAYMGHLRDNYPYLFSLAVRTNPFDPTASPEVV